MSNPIDPQPTRRDPTPTTEAEKETIRERERKRRRKAKQIRRDEKNALHEKAS